EGAEAGDDGRVVGEAAVAVQLDEPRKEAIDVVLGVGPRRVARQLHLLPGRQVGEDLLLQLARARVRQSDVGAQLGRAAADAHELLDLSLELDDGALEVEGGDVGRRSGAGGFGHGTRYLNAARMRAAISSRSASFT